MRLKIKPTTFVDESAMRYEQERGVKDNPNSVLNKTNNLRNMLLYAYYIMSRILLHVKIVKNSFPSRFKVGLEGGCCLWDIYSELN